MTLHPFTCEHCKQQFQSTKRHRKFCSQDCRDLHRRVLPFSEVERFARAGMSKAEISRELGCSYIAVRRAIERYYGLQSEWSEMRFI